MSVRPTSWLAWVAVTALALAGSAQLAAAGGPQRALPRNIKHPDYQGHLGPAVNGQQGELRIEISQRDRQGRPKAGLFQPKTVPVYCVAEDGAERWTLLRVGPANVYFHRKGRAFDGFQYSEVQNYEFVMVIKGTLIQGGAHAEGMLSILANPSGAGGQEACTTQGRRLWSARRVKAT